MCAVHMVVACLQLVWQALCNIYRQSLDTCTDASYSKQQVWNFVYLVRVADFYPWYSAWPCCLGRH
jgi:hypothetical protein